MNGNTIGRYGKLDIYKLKLKENVNQNHRKIESQNSNSYL